MVEEAKQGATGNPQLSQDGAAKKTNEDKGLYILQIKRDKLTEERMRTLKCLILHIIRTKNF